MIVLLVFHKGCVICMINVISVFNSKGSQSCCTIWITLSDKLRCGWSLSFLRLFGHAYTECKYIPSECMISLKVWAFCNVMLFNELKTGEHFMLLLNLLASIPNFVTHSWKRHTELKIITGADFSVRHTQFWCLWKEDPLGFTIHKKVYWIKK